MATFVIMYWAWQWADCFKEAGRTRLVYVGAAEEVALAEGNGRYRQFRQHRTAVAKLSKEALGLIDQLGRALTAPPPRRRRRRGS